MKSPGLKSEKDFIEKAVANNLTQQQASDIYFYHDRARKAFEQRESQSELLDGLGYYQDYMLNRQAANSFLRPKKNDDEVRVNTGTTEKKIEVVWNELLKMTWDIEGRAFDMQDRQLVSLGQNWADVIKRTNEIERDEDLWAAATLEGLCQRRVFIEEIWDNGVVRDKRQDKVHRRQIAKAKKRLISGLKVFLGDESLPWYRFNDQPYIIKYDRIHWKEAERRYKYQEDGTENPMWKYVDKGNNAAFDGIFGLRYGVIQEDEVEVLTYMSYPDDEYVRLLNGVPIDKVGTKLPWEYEGYNLKQFGLKPMGLDSAISKPLTASSKTLQALNNETIRLMIRKFRQVLEPPKGVKTGKVFSKDIFSPGAMTQGIKEGDIVDLISHTGLNQSEFNMFQLIENKVEEFVGASGLQQGIGEEGQQTATEIQALQKQFATQLGHAVMMCMAMRREMGYLRIYNILEHVQEPITKNIDPVSQKVNSVYLSFSLPETNLGEGMTGTKEIVFTDKDPEPAEVESLFEQEEQAAKIGKPFRRYFMNIEKLLTIPYQLYLNVTQGFKDSEALDKIMFQDSLKAGVMVSQIAGQPIDGARLIQDFEQIWKKRSFFQKAPPMMLDQGLLGGGMEGSDQGNDLKPKRTQEPSLNTMLNA